MIAKTIGYQSSDGIVHGSLAAAQQHELVAMFQGDCAVEQHCTPSMIAHVILKNGEKIIDILTTTSKSKVRARKINGGTRTRKPKRHEAEQFPLPMEDTTQPAA